MFECDSRDFLTTQTIIMPFIESTESGKDLYLLKLVNKPVDKLS